MKFSDIAHLRLINQQVSVSNCKTPKELVQWMGALQAQDYNMVKWAMGVRLPGSTRKDIEEAIERGDIIRTHLLRPTWHFVAAEDLRWILELTAPRIRTALRTRHKFLGLTDKLVSKSNAVIVKALAESGPLPRTKLVQHLEDAGFENKDNLASHLLICAEMDGTICSGPTMGTDYTYALLDERVPETDTSDREEALAKLARTYFNSHGPATLEDFTWWSGLTITGVRAALEMVKPDLQSAEIDSQTWWFSNTEPPSEAADLILLLPAYDEYIISYKSRDVVIPDKDHSKAFSNNGIFRPVIVVNGQAVGIWKRSVKEDTVIVEIDFFRKPTGKIKEEVEEAAGRYADFLGKKLKVKL